MQNIKSSLLFSCLVRKSRVEEWKRVISKQQLFHLVVHLTCTYTIEHTGINRHIDGQCLRIPVLPVLKHRKTFASSRASVRTETLFAMVILANSVLQPDVSQTPCTISYLPIFHIIVFNFFPLVHILQKLSKTHFLLMKS